MTYQDAAALEILYAAERRFNAAGRVFHFTDISLPQKAINRLVELGFAQQTGWQGLFKKKPRPCYILINKPCQRQREIPQG